MAVLTFFSTRHTEHRRLEEAREPTALAAGLDVGRFKIPNVLPMLTFLEFRSLTRLAQRHRLEEACEPTALAAGLGVWRLKLPAVLLTLMLLATRRSKRTDDHDRLTLRNPRLAPSAHRLCSSAQRLNFGRTSIAVLGLLLCLCQLSNAQETPAKPTSSLAGSIKIVKLLWKSNPKSAATTLAKSLAVALERDQQTELAESLAPLKELLEQSLTSETDPRFGVSLAALSIVNSSDATTRKMLQAAIEKGESENLELLVRTWFLVDSETAFDYLATNLGQAPKSLPIVIQTALTIDRNRAATAILAKWNKIPREQQFTTIEPLSAQATTMLKLVEAVKAGVVNKELVNTNQLRKWQSSDNAQLTAAIESVWGRIRESDNEQRQKLVQTRLKLLRGKNSQGEDSKGSVARGQLVFNRVCAQCHQLHGAGLEVGPSITNNGRGNLDQLISNILDPSLVIGNAFQARTVLTVDGQVVAGLVVADDERFLRIKVQGGKVLEFDKSQDIEQVKVSDKSLMPDGLEEQMTEQEFIDLVALLCLVKSPTEADNELIPGTPNNLVNP